jgi:membrane-bound lytic murein transglycosylase MltF
MSSRAVTAGALTARPRSAVALVLCLTACSNPSPPAESAAGGPSSAPVAAAPPATSPSPASPYSALPGAAATLLDRPFGGDLDEMIRRRLIRAGVVFNRTQYFIDRGTQHGMAYEALQLFEEQLNLRAKTGELKVHVAFVPLSRDQLFTSLTAGKVDLVAAGVTVTPERRRLVDFSLPTRLGVNEIPVTGAGVPPMAGVDDLSGRRVFVRRSSSYYESLLTLNGDLERRGKPPVVIEGVPEALEDDDLLEMVNAGLLEATIVDDYVARFWQQVFPMIALHPNAAVRAGGTLAVAVRKGNPRLLKAVNTWIEEYGPRSTFGNIMDRRYLRNADYVTRAADGPERKKFEAVVALFKTYSDRYGLDYLLMAAQGYQESRLDQQRRSHVGAVGVMQVMPATGRDLDVGDIRQVEPNVHAGVKYIRLLIDRHFADPSMDRQNQILMALAAYNAGPTRIRQLREDAGARGLDPNLWFGNVERVVSEQVGRETVQYVGNIYKYYVAYRLAQAQVDQRGRARARAS